MRNDKRPIWSQNGPMLTELGEAPGRQQSGVHRTFYQRSRKAALDPELPSGEPAALSKSMGELARSASFTFISRRNREGAHHLCYRAVSRKVRTAIRPPRALPLIGNG